MIKIDYMRFVNDIQTRLLTRPVFDAMIDSKGTCFYIDLIRDGKPEYKHKLPGICWQASYAQALRCEANARPNGLFALDIDHIGAEAVDELWARTRPRIDALDIVCFHRSPSGDGAHLVSMCQNQFDTIAENQAWLAGELKTPYDAACHDLARLFFVSKRDDFYYIDYETLFEDERLK